MFDSLEPEDKVSYLKDCLPRKPYNDVVEEHQTYTDETVQQLISEGKRIIISQMQQGRDQWEYLMENMDVFADDYKVETSYRTLAYYLSAMGDSGLGTYPHPFSMDEGSKLGDLMASEQQSVGNIIDYLISSGDVSVEKAFSSVGSDIWNGLSSEPSPRLAFFEDPDHLYLEYWLKTDSKQQFHERRGEFVEFPVLRKIICRVHFDEGFVELRGRNEREKDKESAIIAAKNFLNDDISFSTGDEIATDGGRDYEITDETIRFFYSLPEFQRLSHANKDGTATSSWTADDVRNDAQFPDDRPNNYNNLVFDLDSVGRVSFQINAEDNSYQIFKHKIMPASHRLVSEYIWENINNAPN